MEIYRLVAAELKTVAEASVILTGRLSRLANNIFGFVILALWAVVTAYGVAVDTLRLFVRGVALWLVLGS